MKFFNNIIQKIKNTKAIVSIMAFVSILTMPNISFAQNLFTPVGGDLSVLMLNKLFGGLIGTGGADPLLDLITTFNSAVLTIGGILVAYTIFAGTIGTAHDGQMLGKKFSSVWVPLRTAIGTALVIPINGYCGMQYIVMWLVLQGVGLADTVWISAVSGNSLQTSISRPTYKPNQAVIDLANNIFKSSVCTIANQQNATNILGINSVWGITEQTFGSSLTGGYIKFGSNLSITDQDLCGKINLLSETKAVMNLNNYMFATVNSSLQDTSQLEIVKAHNAATRRMVSELYSAANNFVTVQEINQQKYLQTDINALTSNYIQTAVNNYVNTVSSAVQSRYAAVDDGKAVAQNASQEGWLMAGAWFMKIANQMSIINAELNNVPPSKYNPGSASKNSEEVQKVLAQVNAALAKDSYNSKNLGIANQNDKDRINSGDNGWSFGRLMALLGEAMTGVDIENISNQNGVHPIVQAKAMGDQLIAASISFIGGILVAAGSLGILFGNIAGQAAGANSAFLAGVILVSPMVFIIFGGMLGMGWFLSFYIPMMPFMIWMGALVGWFIMVTEAIFAAPLWAVMHLHPNGDDVVGRGGNGYMLVLGLLVRPTLMIFGLLAAIILSMVLGDFLNTVFYEVFKMSRNGESLSNISILFAFIIYISVFTTFIKKMFDIIHIIPDQLLQWIGGGGSQLGQYAGTMLQGTQGTFTAAGAALGNVAQRGLPDAVQSLQNNLRNKLEKQGQLDQKNYQAKDNLNSASLKSGLGNATEGMVDNPNSLQGLAEQTQIHNAGENLNNAMTQAGYSDAEKATAAANFQDKMMDNKGMQVRGSDGKERPATIGERIASAMQDVGNDQINKAFGGGVDGNTLPSQIMSATAGNNLSKQGMFHAKMAEQAKASGGVSSPAFQAGLKSSAAAVGEIASVMQSNAQSGLTGSSGASQSVAAMQSVLTSNNVPMNSELSKAQQSYGAAVERFGASSSQAINAGRHLAAKTHNSIMRQHAINTPQTNNGYTTTPVSPQENSGQSAPQMDLDFSPPPIVNGQIDNDKQA